MCAWCKGAEASGHRCVHGGEDASGAKGRVCVWDLGFLGSCNIKENKNKINKTNTQNNM